MKSLGYLHKNEFHEIHTLSLELLKQTGIRVMNREAQHILTESGCDISGDVVKFPEVLVEKCLESVPSSFKLYSRDASQSFDIGDEDILFNPGSSAAFFKDRNSGEIRKGTSQDLVDLVHVVEHLDHIKAQSTALIPSDLPFEISGFHRLYSILKDSKKPIITGAFTKDDFHVMRRMLEIVAGGAESHAERPQAIFDCCPSSPLTWSDTTCQNLIDCAKASIPAQIVPAPLMGISSPVTIEGTLVQQNMEIISGIVIGQLINPRTPMVYGGAIGSLDMKLGTPRFSSVEAILTACMSNEIGKFYGIPTHAYLGTSESKSEDSQSGYETGLGLILGVLSRINVISGPGLLAQLNCQSLEKLVIDNEYCGSALQLIKNSGNLIFDEIKELIDSVGPGGDYLKQKHTRKNYRNKHLFPSDILCRLNIQSWVDQGEKTTLHRAGSIVEEILKKDHPPVLEKSCLNELNEVYAQARKSFSS